MSYGLRSQDHQLRFHQQSIAARSKSSLFLARGGENFKGTITLQDNAWFCIANLACRVTAHSELWLCVVLCLAHPYLHDVLHRFGIEQDRPVI